MSEPLKSVHVRLPVALYEQLMEMAEYQRRDVALHSRVLLEKTICGEWYHYAKRRDAIVAAVNAMQTPGSYKSKKTSGFVYVIRLGEFCKIGRSVAPQRRINGMTLPQKPEIICVIETDNPRDEERRLHQKYKKYRHHREWFALPDSVIKSLRGRNSV